MSERTDKAAALAGQSVPLAERDEASLTPLQKQYYEIKSQHSQYLLFFRLGDFYELFDEDAVLASRELDLALTTRDRGKPADEQMPMVRRALPRRGHLHQPPAAKGLQDSHLRASWKTPPRPRVWSSATSCA